LRIGFIGAGKVGLAFGAYLFQKGFNVIGYYSRRYESGLKGAKLTKGIAFTEIKELVENSDIIFITTNDDEIANVCNSLVNNNILKNGQIIVHMSGACSSKVLERAKEMKKIVCVITILVLLLGASFSSFALEVPTLQEQHIKIMLNGKYLNLDVPPIIKNNRTMLPFRAIFEALGAEVDWNEQTKTASGLHKNGDIYFTLENEYARKYSKDGEKIKLDAYPFIQDGRMLVPVRVIAEFFGLNVGWDEKSRTVIMTSSFLDKKEALEYIKAVWVYSSDYTAVPIIVIDNKTVITGWKDSEIDEIMDYKVADVLLAHENQYKIQDTVIIDTYRGKNKITIDRAMGTMTWSDVNGQNSSHWYFGAKTLEEFNRY